jgi:hypothetical protein
MELHRCVALSSKLILAQQNLQVIQDCRLQLAQQLPKTQSDQQLFGVQLWLRFLLALIAGCQFVLAYP